MIQPLSAPVPDQPFRSHFRPSNAYSDAFWAHFRPFPSSLRHSPFRLRHFPLAPPTSPRPYADPQNGGFRDGLVGGLVRWLVLRLHHGLALGLSTRLIFNLVLGLAFRPVAKLFRALVVMLACPLVSTLVFALDDGLRHRLDHGLGAGLDATSVLWLVACEMVEITAGHMDEIIVIAVLKSVPEYFNRRVPVNLRRQVGDSAFAADAVRADNTVISRILEPFVGQMIDAPDFTVSDFT